MYFCHSQTLAQIKQSLTMFPTFIELTYSKCALQNAQSMQFTNPSNLGATSPPISLTLKQVLYLSS